MNADKRKGDPLASLDFISAFICVYLRLHSVSRRQSAFTGG
jgi:hypothetical protein